MTMPPVAHTPPGGYGDTMPPPILAGVDDDLAAGAPDLRGTWRIVEMTIDGAVVSDHPLVGTEQRIEQAGDRVVVTSGGVIHDMRCDGTLENGVHDVAASDFATEVHVTASFEDGVHVLRPDGLPVEVRRWRDGDQMVWSYAGLFTARCERV